jgi:hypothetical protein
VMIEGRVTGFDPTVVHELSFSIDQANWTPINATTGDFNLDYKIFREGITEIVLDPATFLNDWGGYSYRTYLPPTMVNQEMSSMAADFDFVMYENGVPLPYPKGPDVIRQGGGQYVLDKNNMLLFSTPDGSDPRTNGREYKIRATTYRSLDEPFGRYRYYLRACQKESPADFSFERSMKVETLFQYNRLLLPKYIESLKNFNPQTVIEVNDDLQ